MKSQKVVHFPFDNFDPTPYLAAVPQETILRHKELLEMNEITQTLAGISEKDDTTTTTKLNEKALETQTTPTHTTAIPSPNNGNGNNTSTNTPTNNSLQTNTTIANNTTKPLNGLTREAQLSLNDQVNNLLNLQNHTQILDNCSNIVATHNNTSDASAVNSSNHTNNDNLTQTNDLNDEESADKILDNTLIMENMLLRKNEGDRTMTRRKRLISTSLTKTPIIDGEFEDYHQHKLKNGEDKFDPKYKLYAVVVSKRSTSDTFCGNSDNTYT